MIKLTALLIFIALLSSCASDSVSTEFPPEKPDANLSAPKVDANLIPETAVAAAPKVQSAVNKPSELDLAVAAGDDERIRQAGIELLQLNPKNVKALNVLAMYHYRKHQFAAAVLLLNKGLSVSPKSSEIYNNYALIELAKNDKREAINLFRKSLQLNPENYTAAANLASVYAKEKDFAKVVFVLEKAVKKEKANINSLNNYAIALSAAGKTKEASEIYEGILKTNADHKYTMLNYSILMIEKLEKYKEGLDLLNRLKFVGTDNESRQVIKDLEIKAKAGLK